MRRASLAVPLSGLLALAACGGSSDEGSGLPTFLELAGPVSPPNPPSPVDDGLFAMPGSAAAPGVAPFEGALQIQGNLFWGRSIELVQDGRELIPVRRGLIEEPLSAWSQTWNWILEPGHIWGGRDGYALASLPIALVPRGQNCVYNGVLAFTFDGAAVSDVWLQFTAETCKGSPIDAALRLTATYVPGGIADAQTVRANHADERAHRLPTRSIADLARVHPGLDVSAFGRDLRDTSVYGLIVDGVNYVSDCPTRHGRYAYCDVMRLPSFSTAKSAFAGLAFLRLGQKYGPEIADLLLKDTLPELRDDTAGTYPGWETVTIENVLDMASGHYGVASTFDDAASNRLFDGSSAAAITRGTLALPALAPPATRFFYRSCETFMAVRAMQSFLRTQTTPTADLFDFVVDEVYRPLGIGRGFFTTMRTPDAERQALGALGLFWTVDDVAKLTTFLQGGSRHAGQQLLHPALLDDSFFRNPDDRGLQQMDNADSRYNNAFWGQIWGPGTGNADLPCNFHTTRMTGYGGIEISLLPNGTVYYYFNDADVWTSRAAVRESNHRWPICQ